MRSYASEIKRKIKLDGIEQLFINIEKEIYKIMVESGSVDKKDLSKIKKSFIKEMTLKSENSLKVNIEVKKLIISGIKEIILKTINKEINLLN